MTDDSCVFDGLADEPSARGRYNSPPRTVSELSFALKRALKNRFGHLRLQIETSQCHPPRLRSRLSDA